jgi:hypothetical protein
MILCHEYRFIFLKTNKTAGNSIEIALSKFCGENDIVTPFSPEAEAARLAAGYRGAQNFRAPIQDYRLLDVKRLIRTRKPKKIFYNHISAGELKKLLDADVWNDYYKFCVERNPWERCISLYYWFYRTEPRPTFSEYLRSDVPLKLKHRGHGVYTIGGEVVVDRICRFENLEEDLEIARLEIGLPEPLSLGHANVTHRKDRRSHREILSDADRDFIAELFKEEIEMFGYEF